MMYDWQQWQVTRGSHLVVNVKGDYDASLMVGGGGGGGRHGRSKASQVSHIKYTT